MPPLGQALGQLFQGTEQKFKQLLPQTVYSRDDKKLDVRWNTSAFRDTWKYIGVSEETGSQPAGLKT